MGQFACEFDPGSKKMKILIVGAGVTSVVALGGIIATWSIIYSADIGPAEGSSSNTTTTASMSSGSSDSSASSSETPTGSTSSASSIGSTSSASSESTVSSSESSTGSSSLSTESTIVPPTT